MSSDPAAAPDPLPTRRRRSDGERSRAAILGEAARLATVEGLDGVSIGRLADAVGMSKSGLFAHFGSKEELLLATIEAADAVFAEEVVAPAAQAPPGLARLRAYTELFFDHVARGTFPGGCFFVSAVSDLATRPGPARDRALASVEEWMAHLGEQVAAAQSAGELDPAADAEQVVFELAAFMRHGNSQFVLGTDDRALERARRAVASCLAALAPPAA